MNENITATAGLFFKYIKCIWHLRSSPKFCCGYLSRNVWVFRKPKASRIIIFYLISNISIIYFRKCLTWEKKSLYLINDYKSRLKNKVLLLISLYPEEIIWALCCLSQFLKERYGMGQNSIFQWDEEWKNRSLFALNFIFNSTQFMKQPQTWHW